MKYLLKDVNLSDIFISKSGRQIVINFINMSNGDACSSLIADNVIVFNYHNSFDDSEDAFPTYIGEVTCKELEREEVSLYFQGLGYNFKDYMNRYLTLKSSFLLARWFFAARSPGSCLQLQLPE